ncbi:MAG TPA: tRNA-intron lyase [archaeon]|nr:tRNA-intron lyase [archaeon]
MNVLSGETVIVFDSQEMNELLQRGFGEKKEKQLYLSLFEALYLIEKGKFSVEDSKGAGLSEADLIKTGSKDKNFLNKLIVYRDLRERGFVVKTGLKFGFDFRVYPRGKKPGQAHTQWVINVKGQEKNFSWNEFARMVRMSLTLRTKLLQAVVDSDKDVSYFEFTRVTP